MPIKWDLNIIWSKVQKNQLTKLYLIKKSIAQNCCQNSVEKKFHFQELLFTNKKNQNLSSKWSKYEKEKDEIDTLSNENLNLLE